MSIDQFEGGGGSSASSSPVKKKPATAFEWKIYCREFISGPQRAAELFVSALDRGKILAAVPPRLQAGVREATYVVDTSRLANLIDLNVDLEKFSHKTYSFSHGRFVAVNYNTGTIMANF